MTQNNYFTGQTHVGIGEESGDLSFPDLHKIADAYGFRYFESKNLSDLGETLDAVLGYPSYCICQIYVTKEQITSPKVSSRKLPNGSFASATLEDMSPFLSREELAQNMYIDTL